MEVFLGKPHKKLFFISRPKSEALKPHPWSLVAFFSDFFSGFKKVIFFSGPAFNPPPL